MKLCTKFERSQAVRQTDGQMDGQRDRQTEFSSLDRISVSFCFLVRMHKVAIKQIDYVFYVPPGI